MKVLLLHTLLKWYHRATARTRTRAQQLFIFLLETLVGKAETDRLIEPIHYQAVRNPSKTSLRLCGFIDHLTVEQIGAEYEVTVTGWLFDIYQPITSVALYVDESTASLADIQRPKPGVGSVFPHIPSALYSGFNCVFRLRRQPPEQLTLRCKVLLPHGEAIFSYFEPAPVAWIPSVEKTPKTPDLSATANLTVVLYEQFIKLKEPLQLPTSIAPRFSIVLSGSDCPATLIRCLRSIRDQTTEAFEVHARCTRTSATRAFLTDHVKGLASISETDEELRPLVKSARGEYLVFLNSDLRLTSETLCALLAEINGSQSPTVFTGLIVDDNGRVLEAGGIIAKSAGLRFYGNGLPASSPECLFQRDTDFGSSSFLVVDRKKFIEYGGFADEFQTAVYKDADLCLRLRSAGLVIKYAPQAVALVDTCVHPARSELDSNAASNDKATFFKKHSARLQATAPDDMQSDLFARHAKQCSSYVLVVLSELPQFEDQMGFSKIRQLLAGLDEGTTFVTVALSGKAAQLPANAASFSPGTEVFRMQSPETLAAFLSVRYSYYSACILSGAESMTLYRNALEHLQDQPLSFKVIYEASADCSKETEMEAAQQAHSWNELLAVADRVIVWSEAVAEPLRELTAIKVDVLVADLPPTQLSKQLDHIINGSAYGSG